MVKLKVIGLFATLSFSAFSQDSFDKFSLINKTDPNQQILFECLDSDCSAMEVSYQNISSIISSRILYNSEIEEMAKIKKKISLHENSLPFVFTRDVLSNVERQWKNGEEMTAVGNVALSFMTGIFDTVMLPIQLVFAPALINVDTVSGKDGGRKIRTITKNKRDIYLKSKRFLKIKNALEV